MQRRALAAAGAALSLALIGAVALAAPADASTTLRVKVLHQIAVSDGYYASIDYQYSCPPGSTVSVTADLQQPSSGAHFDSSYSTDPIRVLTCDGRKHETSIGVVSIGWDEDDTAGYDAPYLQDSVCLAPWATPAWCTGSRSVATITVVAGTQSDQDATRIDTVDRENDY